MVRLNPPFHDLAQDYACSQYGYAVHRLIILRKNYNLILHDSDILSEGSVDKEAVVKIKNIAVRLCFYLRQSGFYALAFFAQARGKMTLAAVHREYPARVFKRRSAEAHARILKLKVGVFV